MSNENQEDDSLKEWLLYRDKYNRLVDALRAGYMLSHGRAYILVKNGLLMEIGNARRERVIRKALEEADNE